MGVPSGLFLWDRHQARLYFWCWNCTEQLPFHTRREIAYGRSRDQVAEDDETPAGGSVHERSEDLGV